MSPFNKFDISKVDPQSTSDRKSLIDIKSAALIDPQTGMINAEIPLLTSTEVAESIFKIKLARKNDNPVILCMGAHAIKNGCGPLINSLIKNNIITHIATNGAGIIHDTEFGAFGVSTEDVRENLSNGSFGIWRDIGALFNEALSLSQFTDRPIGNSFGQLSISRGHEYKKYTIGWGAFHYNIPLTIHPALGQDIIASYPRLNWGLLGERSREDFLYFAESIRRLSGGVFISCGSAVMSPMIFEKALSMSRHVEQKEGRDVNNFTVIVNDIIPQGKFDWSKGQEPPKDDPAYYLRFLKSFYRSGGDVKYVAADNRSFLYSIWNTLVK